MKPSTNLWLQGIAGQFIEGAADAFLIVAGGSSASQLIATTPTPALTLRELVVSTFLGGAIYAASYLKKHPLPETSISPVPVVTPQPPTSP